ACDAIIFNSRRVADAHFAAYGFPRRRACIIPNGELVTARDRSWSGIPATRIGSVGRVTEAKGADLLLDAFDRVARTHPAVALTYYGDGPLIPLLRRRAEAMGLAGRV